MRFNYLNKKFTLTKYINLLRIKIFLKSQIYVISTLTLLGTT